MIYYRYKTSSGEFRIAQDRSGRWLVMFEEEELGSYGTAQQALDDLAGGHTFWPSCGDPSRFKLPEEIGDWEPVRR